MSPPWPDAVLKVGGSLYGRPRQLRRLMGTLEALAGPRTFVVVPGGGAFADEVRRADRRFGLDGSSSHWMAILAMDQSAYLLRALAAGAVLVRSPEDVRRGRVNVLAPSTWLIRADPLPHSWEVTSDSIAAWVARTLRAKQLILLKSVDGVPAGGRTGSRPSPLRPRATPGQLRDLVDDYFGRALGPDMPCWIVSGARPQRVTALLMSGSTLGTEVISYPEDQRRPPSRDGAVGRDRRRGRG
jgi:5-(aminomethyl)-3-furanmethanol phosphate kinase